MSSPPERPADTAPPNVPALMAALTARDPEEKRAASRALWQAVRHAGRPAAANERRAMVAQLLPGLASGQPDPVHREVLWMLSEIAGDEAIEPMAALLKDPACREDARMALERLPGAKVLAALRTALAEAPADFQPSIAQALRARGADVPGFPPVNMKPTRETSVKPVQA